VGRTPLRGIYKAMFLLRHKDIPLVLVLMDKQNFVVLRKRTTFCVSKKVSGKPMTTESKMTKSNKTLLIFSILHTAITIYFVVDIKSNESASLRYLFLFPAFWLVGGLILGLLFWLTKIKLKTTLDKITVAFSTPAPMIVFFFIWSMLPYSQSPASTYEYNSNGHRHKQVKYQYHNGQTKTIEYYISQDSITEENPLPENVIWLKDSIWTFTTKTEQLNEKNDIRRAATNSGNSFASHQYIKRKRILNTSNLSREGKTHL
jgi:hypothetical protein